MDDFIALLFFIPIVLILYFKQIRSKNRVFYLYKNKYSYNIKIINKENIKNIPLLFSLKCANCVACAVCALCCMLECIFFEEIKLKILFVFLMFSYLIILSFNLFINDIK